MKNYMGHHLSHTASKQLVVYHPTTSPKSPYNKPEVIFLTPYNKPEE